jgi:DNA-binding MarR family transcriptional regulator
VRTTSAQRSAAAQVRAASTALASRVRVERRGELTLNQTAVLGRVVRLGPLTPGEIAAQLRMVPQALTRTFAALEAAGYLRRTPDPGDGRQSLLEATAAGRRALRSEMKPRDEWLAVAMNAVLSADEIDQLVAASELMNRVASFDADVAVVER